LLGSVSSEAVVCVVDQQVADGDVWEGDDCVRASHEALLGGEGRRRLDNALVAACG
jgi:hypothetical protein